MDYFSEIPIYIFSGLSVFVDQYMSGYSFNVSSLISISLPTPPLLLEINYFKYNI